MTYRLPPEENHFTGAAIFIAALVILVLPVAFLWNSSGCKNGCSNMQATQFGANWVVTEQNAVNGAPYRCWTLKDTSIMNEDKSDGIYWKDSQSGNLVHISGHYTRVQVIDGNWDKAFAYIGLTKESCEMINKRVYDPKLGIFTDLK